MITGFLAGAAVDVVIGELPKLTGTSADGVNAWRELGSWVHALGDVHGTTLVVGLVALGVILGLRFLAPAVPGALVLVAGGILASHLFRPGGPRCRYRRARAAGTADAAAAQRRRVP